MIRDIFFAVLFFALGILFTFWAFWQIGKRQQKTEIRGEAGWDIRDATPDERMDWLKTGRLPK